MGVGTGEPGAPRHKLSDSHSSLSSFASSSFSATHSRMSSATTISGVNSINSLQMELPLLDSKLVQLPEAVEVPTMGSVQPPSPAYPMTEQYAHSLAMTRCQSSTPGFLEHSSNAGLNKANVSNRHLTSTTDFPRYVHGCSVYYSVSFPLLLGSLGLLMAVIHCHLKTQPSVHTTWERVL